MMRILFLIYIFIFTACQTKNLENKNHAQAIVFVPGFYGSELVRADNGEKVWITLSEALFGSTSIAIPNAETKIEGLKLQAKDLLSSVNVVPGIYSYSIYEPTFNFLKEHFEKDYVVESFAYDWRKDGIETIRELDKFIQDLRAKGIKDITLVSHSLGAYLCAYYLRFGTQEPDAAVEDWAGAKLIHKAALLTAPFKGSGFIFRNFHYGRGVAWNKKILDPKAFASFPISYYFVPQLQKDFIVDKDRHPMNISVADAKEWKKNGWGLFFSQIENQGDEVTSRNRFEFTKNYLRRGKNFMLAMNLPPRKKAPLRIFSLVADNGPTINQIKELGPSQIEDPYDGDPLLKAPGDGTLTIDTQALPSAFKGDRLVTVTMPGGHLEVLSREDLREMLKSWILNREKN